MKTNFFFVIYLHDKVLKTYFDCLRLVADSNQKNYAHITVKGPYKTNQQKLLNDDSTAIRGEEVKVIGVGNFFEENQNTVFLKCEDNKNLYNVWKRKEEKTYKQFHPHITIYDGGDNFYARQLFETIEKYEINFTFKIESLELYSTKNKTENDLYNLKTSEDYYKLISRIADKEITRSNIEVLTNLQRLKIIDSLCNELEQIGIEKHTDTYFQFKTNNNVSLLLEA